jgi:L-fuconolactonase
MPMIDSHAHLISDDAMRYPPAPPSGEVKPEELANPMTLKRLLGEMDQNGVSHAVLVQRGTIYGFDNRYVCDCARQHPDRLAAVCAIDANAADGVSAVRRWVSEGAGGIRMMELVKGSDLSWLDSPNTREVWRVASDLHVPVCVHFFPWNRVAGLQALRSILSELPNLLVVIDHFSNMNSAAGPPDHGVDELLQTVAAFGGVHVKFTTIPLGRLQAAKVDAAPVVARVVKLFGAERVMWGSDISQTPGSYDSMVQLGREAVGRLEQADREQVLSGTARAMYGSAWK